MSATLAYYPVKPTKEEYLNDKLRFIFTEKYELHDGGYNLSSDDIPYLEGLMDAGHQEIGNLIAYIQKYDKVSIFLSY